MRNINKEADDFKRIELKKLYEQLTTKQQNFFNKLFACGIDKIKETDIKTAFDLCQRTLKKNTT